MVFFAGKYPEKKVLFVIVGSSSTGMMEKQFLSSLTNIPNIDLKLMGAISPLPSNLIRLFDVCVASYGCAIISDKLRIPTIMMLDDDHIPLGIMGYTLRNWPYTLNRVNWDKPISGLMSDVLSGHICDQMEYQSTDYGVDYSTEEERHVVLLEASAKEKSYYDVTKIKDPRVKRRIIAFASRIMGMKNIERLRRVKTWLKTK